MTDSKVLSFTGAFEVAAGVLLLVATPHYLVMGAPPSLGNETQFAAYVTRSNTIAIVTKLVDVVYLVGFIVFAAGLRHLIRRVRPDDEWLAALVWTSRDEGILASAAAGLVLAGFIVGEAVMLKQGISWVEGLYLGLGLTISGLATFLWMAGHRRHRLQITHI
jgi:hypothetical protein